MSYLIALQFFSSPELFISGSGISRGGELQGGSIFQAIGYLSDQRWSEAGPPSTDKTTCVLINSCHHLIWMNTTVIGSLTVISSVVIQDVSELIGTDRQHDVQEYICS